MAAETAVALPVSDFDLLSEQGEIYTSPIWQYALIRVKAADGPIR